MSTLLKILLGFFFILFIGVAGVGAWAYTQFQPADPSNAAKVRFTVPKGQSVTSIGYRLQEAGLIKNSLVFRYVVSQEGLGGKIQAGSFELSPSMTPSQIAQQLTQGTNDVWITVLEGWRVEEIADMLDQKGLDDFDKEEFIKLAKDSEGYLYPDTYLIPRLATAESIYDLLTNTFDKKVKQGLEKEISASDRDLEDIITMASIVQREAMGYEDMRMVAGILWGRVDRGMGLNVDATLQYLRGYDRTQQSWWTPPSADLKASTSPFNTYKNAGLPPHPIANPGMDAIKATLEPEKSDYVYYLHDSRGQIHFAKTLEEHNANVEKYLR